MTDAAGPSLTDSVQLAGRVEAAAKLSRTDPIAASRDLDALIEAADAAGEVAIVASARYALARVHVSLGAADSALELISAAEQGWRSIGEVDAALRTNLGRMNVLDDLGRHAEAAELGRRMCDELAGRPTDDDEMRWLRAAAQENLGVALGYLGRHAEALAAYAGASEIYDELGLAGDSARALANRGVELNELARPAEAIPALQGAHERFVAAGDRLWQGLCQTELAEAWIAAGRYFEAFRSLDAAESALTGLDETSDWLRAELGRAECLQSLDLDVESLDLYDELAGPLEDAGLLHDVGKVHLGRGTILARSARPEDAEAAFDQAFAAFESVGNDAMSARVCLAAASLGARSGEMIARAIALLSDAERPAELAFAWLAAAEHFEARDPQRADEAVAHARRLIEPLGVPSLRWRLHHRTARMMRRNGDTAGAQRELERAVSVLDGIRSTLDRDGVRQRFDGARDEAADDLVELLLDAGDIEAAATFAESTRGRALVERLRGELRAPAVATPIDELLATYDRLLTARGPLVGELSSQARRLERIVGSADPAGASSAPESAPVAPLPERTVLYQCIGDEVAAFVRADGQVVAMRKLCELSRVSGLLDQLDAQWRRFAHPDVVARYGDRMIAATDEILRELDLCLVEPIRHHLGRSGSVTIVPDGPIGAVPFAALRHHDRYLVESLAVRHTPSITVDRIVTRDARPARSVLALGTSDDMAPLASAEAELLGHIWPAAEVHRDDAATSAVLFERARAHDVIHLAGHGLFRSDASEFSALRLADRWVTAAELARLDLDGQLVVLSACDTGRRTTGQVRDTLGLPRALLAAGACGVIVNLWPADDGAMTALMATLHDGLVAGAHAVDALRAAQLASACEHPHPYYWSGTALIGGHAGVLKGH